MKSYNYKKIRDIVKQNVKDVCYSPRNKYKHTAWTHHIQPVVKLSIALSKKVGADREIVELAAYLHDYSSLYKFEYSANHHIHSARLAEKMLKKLGYPTEKIEHIKKCILSHRGSRQIKRNSMEAAVLASADAMSHFTELADMMLLAYGVHKFSTVEGAKWLKSKLQRSWKKIIPAGRKIIKADYDISMKILNKAIQ